MCLCGPVDSVISVVTGGRPTGPCPELVTQCSLGATVGLLSLICDRATRPFLKIDMRYKAYRHGEQYH